MKKFYFTLLHIFIASAVLNAQYFEDFEDETQNANSFSSNGQAFTIVSNASSIFDIYYNALPYGWNGSAPDQRFIDNSGSTTGYNPSFTIKTSNNASFVIDSFYLYVALNNTTLSATGTVTIEGKLNGVTQYNASSNSFNQDVNVANGYTFINLSTYGGQNNSNKAINEITISANGTIRYLGLDALTWDYPQVLAPGTPVAVSAANISQTGFTANWNAAENATGYRLDVSTNSSFSTFVSGYNNLNIGNVLNYNVTGLSAYTTYYYRVRAYNASSTSVSSNSVQLTTKVLTVTWNGSNWVPSQYPDATPVTIDSTVDVIINGEYTTADDGFFTAKSVTVYNGPVTISPGTSITIQDALVNNADVSDFVVENNGNLLQVNNTNNIGDITVKCNSNSLYRLDYTVWSSPVSGQNLFDFSPGTIAERFYTYDTATDSYASVPNLGEESLTEFEVGKGYLIRMPNGGSASYEAGTQTMVFNGVFAGTPNNGNITVGIEGSGEGYNMIGNPYPSPIDVTDFLQQNTSIDGTVWLWRKKNNPNTTSYVTINSVGVYTNNGQPNTATDPEGILRQGQGFIVHRAGGTNTNVVFNNGMRVNETVNAFFRQNNTVTEKHGMWLNVTDTNGFFSQMYTGYISGATTGADAGIDSKYINDKQTVLSTLLNNSEYIINGRGLPFNVQNNEVLQWRSQNAGTFTLSIDHVNGLFLQQDIYLKDNVEGTITNLKEGDYTFYTEAGTFTDRFEIVYNTQSLGVAQHTLKNAVTVYNDNTAITVAGNNTALSKVEIHDISGRLLYNAENLNIPQVTITTVQPKQQVLIVKVYIPTGELSKKILF